VVTSLRHECGHVLCQLVSRAGEWANEHARALGGPGGGVPLDELADHRPQLALGPKLLEIEIALDAASHFVADRAARV